MHVYLYMSQACEAVGILPPLYGEHDCLWHVTRTSGSTTRTLWIFGTEEVNNLVAVSIMAQRRTDSEYNVSRQEPLRWGRPLRYGSRDTANSKVSRRRVVRLSKNKDVDVKLTVCDLAPVEVFPMVPRGTTHVSG